MKLEEVAVGDIIRAEATAANPNPPDLEVVGVLPQYGRVEVRPVTGNTGITIQVPVDNHTIVTKDGAKDLPPESERRDTGAQPMNLKLRDTRDASAKAGDLPMASSAAGTKPETADEPKYQSRSHSRHP